MPLLSDLYERYGRPAAGAALSSSPLGQAARLGASALKARAAVMGRLPQGARNFIDSAGRAAVTAVVRPGVAGGDAGYREQVAAAGGARAYEQRAIQEFNQGGRTDRASRAGALAGGTLPYFVPGANAAVTGAQLGSKLGNVSSQQGILASRGEAAQEAALAGLNLVPGINDFGPLRHALDGARPIARSAGRAAVSGAENVVRGQGASLVEGNGLDLDRKSLAVQFALGAGSHLALNPGETAAAARQYAEGSAQFARNVSDFPALAKATHTFRAEPPSTEVSVVAGVPVTRPADLQTISVPEAQAEAILRKHDGIPPQVIDHNGTGPKVTLTMDSNRNVVSWDADRPEFAIQIGRHAENGSRIQSRQGGFVGPGKPGDQVPGAKGKIRDPRQVLEVDFKPGTKIRAGDRGNIGTVTGTNEDRVFVTFKSKEGTTFSKTFSRGEISPLSSLKAQRSSAVRDPRKVITPGPLPDPAGRKGYGSTGRKLEEPLRDNNPEFNVNRLNVSPEAKQVLSETVENNAKAYEKFTGEKLTNREAIQAAQLTSKTFTKAVGREKTLDWQAALLNTRQEIAKAAESGVVTRDFLENLVAVKTAGTDAARKLQSFSINADPKEATAMERMVSAVLKNDQNVDEILRASVGVDFDDPRQAAQFYRRFVAPKTSEWLDLLRYNSMLSSPNTHINNVFSNAIQSGVVKPVEKAFAGGIDFLAHGTNDKRTHFAGEGPAYSVGYIKSVGEAAHAFADVMTGKSPGTNLDTNRVDLAPGGGLAGGAEKVLGFPMRMLEASDQFFTALAKGGELNALKAKQRKGVKIANPELVAEEAAAKTLFRGELGDKSEGYVLNAIDSVTNLLQAARNSENPLLSTVSKFTVPFLKTPINIFKQGLEYSPAGLATLPGNTDKVGQLAKAAVGSAVFAGAATLLGSNRLTWAEPTSEKEKNAFRAAGMQPYAVKVGDNWVGYAKLGPLAFPIAMVAAIDDAQKNRKLDQGTGEQVLAGIAKYGGFLSDQTYAKGIGDLIKASRTENGVAQVIANDVQQLIPYRALLGWVERLQDDVQRKPDAKAGLVEKQVQYMLAQIPWASSSVPARTDQYGEPIRDTNNLLNAVSPLRVTTEDASAKEEYQAVADKRVADARATYEKDRISRDGAAPGPSETPAGAVPEGVRPLSNGKYAWVKADGTVETEATADKAALSLAKDRVGTGSIKEATVGDSYVYADPATGEAKVASVSKLRSDQVEQQYQSDVEAAKRSDDFAAFSRLSEQEYDRLGQELGRLQSNPFANSADIVSTRNKMADLAYAVSERTGFRGSGSGSSRKVTPPKAVPARPSAGTGKVARQRSPSTLLKKYSVKKPRFARR